MAIYLINSPSRSLIKESINTIVKENSNVIYLDYTTSGLDVILEEAGYISLFADEKYIIVKNANIFGRGKAVENDLKKLQNYLNSPNPSTTIFFTLTEEVDNRKKIVDIIKNQYSLKTIPQLKPRDTTNKIVDILSKNKLQISYDDAATITSKCLNNYDLVVNEIDKLILYYEEGSIVEEDVINHLLTKNLEDNIFHFAEAVIRKDNKMFALFNDLKTSKEKPEVIIGALAREYRLAFKCMELMDRGYSKIKLQSELKLADWMVDKFLKNAMSYRKEELLEKLNSLADTDLTIKKSDMDKYLAIELFLLEV